MSHPVHGCREPIPRSAVKNDLILPGMSAPDFELEDINGLRIRLSNFRGQKPVLLAFLRGFL